MTASLAKIEMRGIPTFPVRDPEGLEVGRVYVLPADSGTPLIHEPMVRPWIVSTAGTAALALLLAFALSGRILRPVGELTAAAHRMRQGTSTSGVTPRGDDEIARLARARSTRWRSASAPDRAHQAADGRATSRTSCARR